MEIKNKKTGEIVEFRYLQTDYVAPLVLTTYENDKPKMYSYNSLAELNEEWEDAPEEPKECWYINEFGTPTKADFVGRETLYDKCRKNFGNYFETEEEAERAVERLRAWKRLKDKGFEFNPVDRYEALCGNGFNIPITATMPPEAYTDAEVSKDLDLLFGDAD